MPGLTRSSDHGTNWIFNLRDHDYDSGSDDSPNDGKQPSSDSQLLKTLDLSTREDNAQYKPNPWTIAKLNAACRPPSLKATGSAIAMPVKETPKKTVYPEEKQTTLEHVFSKQFSRVSPVLKQVKAQTMPQEPSNVPTCHSSLSSSNLQRHNTTSLTRLSSGTPQNRSDESNSVSFAKAPTTLVLMRTHNADLPTSDAASTTNVGPAERMVSDAISDAPFPSIFPSEAAFLGAAAEGTPITDIHSSPNRDYMLPPTIVPRATSQQNNNYNTSTVYQAAAAAFNTPVRMSSQSHCPSLRHAKGSHDVHNTPFLNATLPDQIESTTTIHGFRPVAFPNNCSYSSPSTYRSCSSRTENHAGLLGNAVLLSGGDQDHEIVATRDRPVMYNLAGSPPSSPDQLFKRSVPLAPRKRERIAVSAYTSLKDLNEEDMWSTLPPRKKSREATPSRIKTSAKFILPISILKGKQEDHKSRRNMPLYRPPLAGSKAETENLQILKIRRVHPKDVERLLVESKESGSHAATSYKRNKFMDQATVAERDSLSPPVIPFSVAKVQAMYPVTRCTLSEVNRKLKITQNAVRDEMKASSKVLFNCSYIPMRDEMKQALRLLSHSPTGDKAVGAYLNAQVPGNLHSCLTR
ncbi:hypothetical protein BU17DRAFT_62030 [Hysterangium stoloniferum]|nr:hypothetical protein BU17DRAFT_62030 [Hysterangium stoloniferum]